MSDGLGNAGDATASPPPSPGGRRVSYEAVAIAAPTEPGQPALNLELIQRPPPSTPRKIVSPSASSRGHVPELIDPETVGRGSRPKTPKDDNIDLRGLLFDLDGDQKLNYDEWYAMQPDAVRQKFTRLQMRRWYESALGSKYADGVSIDHDEPALSLNEFFLWALAEAGKMYGSYLAPLQLGSNALGRSFEKYDGNGNGQLDLDEFVLVCDDLGFKQVAKQMFSVLDADDSGSVSYAEMVQSLTTAIPRDLEAKGFLTALVLTLNPVNAESTGEAAASVVDTSGFKPVRGNVDAELLQSELQRLLRESGYQTADLISLFDQTPDDKDSLLKRSKIDEWQFYQTLVKVFGYKGPRSAATTIFDTLDIYHHDAEGEIGFEELYELFRGKRHALDARKRPPFDMRLRPPRASIRTKAATSLVMGSVRLKGASSSLAAQGPPPQPANMQPLKPQPPGGGAAGGGGRAGAGAGAGGGGSSRPRRGRTRQLDELAWDTMVPHKGAAILRVLINDMLATQDWPNNQQPSVADLLREWKAERGLNKREFLEKCKTSFFLGTLGGNEVSDGDLWEIEGQKVVVDAFEQMMKTVVGENFLQRIGLVHLERWLGGLKPDGNGGVRPHVDPNNDYNIRNLPLKSKRQLTAQRSRRQVRERALEEALKAKQAPVDWVGKAQGGIKDALEGREARETAQWVAEAEWVLARTLATAGGGRGRRRPKTSMQVAPPQPLQRWEADVMGELILPNSARPSFLAAKQPAGTLTGSFVGSSTMVSRPGTQVSRRGVHTSGRSQIVTPRAGGGASSSLSAVPRSDQQEYRFQLECVERIRRMRHQRLHEQRLEDLFDEDEEE